MVKHYWVGDFYIDLTRNQITKEEQPKTIPPKALAVLTCLAKNANQVVSQEELLSEVWPNTIVTPNTLQRSIAQLRKVLGEGSQIQSYIKTHAKQGYSLEVEVRWQADNEDELSSAQEPSVEQLTASSDQTKALVQDSQDSGIETVESIEGDNTSAFSLRHLTLVCSLSALVFFSFLGVRYLSPSSDLALSFVELRLLTATDHKEYGAIYSPDGDFVVFLRYSKKICINSNLWAKNIHTQQETQLTANMGHYGMPSFSHDGKTLTFIQAEDCSKPVTQKECYKLMTLDFNKALSTPQSSEVILECQNTRIAGPKWIDNDIAFLHKTSEHWNLNRYSIENNKSEVIYEPEASNILHYDYSEKDNIIALITSKNNGKRYIDVLKPDGQIVSSNPIKFPSHVPRFSSIYPNLIPHEEQLIFSTGRQLFTLSFKGEVNKIELPLDEPVSSPRFHPSFERMLLIKGIWDTDIVSLPLSQVLDNSDRNLQSDQNTNKDYYPLPVFERSTSEEEGATAQPVGELIAFKSERAGVEQVFITDGDNLKQISTFPTDTYIRGFDWAADGQSILVNSNNGLTQFYLESKHRRIPFEHSVTQLFQWNSNDNTALVKANINGVLKFGELNLDTLVFRTITEMNVSWALKSEDGKLIYSDQMNRFWQSGPVEDQLITSLDGEGSDKNFRIYKNVVYGISNDFKLWSYDLSTGAFNTLGNMPENVNYLTDVKHDKVLFSVRINAKKEVAELIFND